MTMGPAETEHKVRQLDNDVQSIYVMLAAIEGTQRRHSNRFQEITEQIDGRFGALDGRFGALDGRFAALDGKMDALDSRMNLLDGKFAALDGRFASLDNKFATLDSKMDTVLELLRGGPPASG